EALLPTPRGFVTAVAFSPDGGLLAVCVNGQTIWLWNTVTGQGSILVTQREPDFHSLLFSPDGKTLAVGTSNNITLWELATSKPTRLSWDLPQFYCYVFSPDGTTLAAVTSDGTVKLWDLAAVEQVGALQGVRTRILALAFSPDTATLAAGCK